MSSEAMSKPRLLSNITATKWRAELSDSTCPLPSRAAVEVAVVDSVVDVAVVAVDSVIEVVEVDVEVSEVVVETSEEVVAEEVEEAEFP